ncbi:MAG: thymidine kinase [Myxococcales bacterium]|nr:thymidine kinase [Myxococcales bacterium]
MYGSSDGTPWPGRVQPGLGWIEVVCGSMFSGKTEELIRRLRRASIGRQKVQVFKPLIDNRYDNHAVVSHSELRWEGIAVERARDILPLVDVDTAVVGVDEAQFFDVELVEVCNLLADRGLRVICAGLDQDYQGRPFEPMPQLLAIAEVITKTMAVCMVCGAPANRSQRLSASESRVVIGAHDTYEARCRKCHSASPSASPEQTSLPILDLENLAHGARKPVVTEQLPLSLREKP